MAKDLKDKAVKIQGKDYVLVSDRVVYFNENYSEGCIKTEMVSPIGSEEIIIKATVIPQTKFPERYFNGYSQAVKGQGYINKTSALENAETSAVGRALAMMGIGVIESIASVDEINKAKSSPGYVPKKAPQMDTQVATPATPAVLKKTEIDKSGSAPQKQCPLCKKWHQGRYTKCMDCWKAERNGQAIQQTKTIINEDAEPFPGDVH